MMNQYEQFYDQWIDSAKDYPTKALLVALMELYKEQEDRIESHLGKLDGMCWSPEGWDE